ncbi:DUF1570 domain-containing protein [Planctomicrobium sp. SH664]|uniref:DUF1570 domain-containing protein n=1 Tax=Planctomicrobium sp. SH664 TaxID=3448125 RepID=UPI003F5C6822
MNRLTPALLTVALLFLSSPARAQSLLVEFTVDNTVYEGTPIVSNQAVCWLGCKDGSYTAIDLSRVSKFQKLTGTFRPYTAEQLAQDLRRRWGHKFEILVRGNYVVCAPPGKTTLYAELLARTADNFATYFSKRSIRLQRAEYPLVVIVWPTREEFELNSSVDGMKANSLLQGYYSPESNRVTLYDITATATSAGAETPIEPSTEYRMLAHPPIAEDLSTATRNTVMHEAIHQLAFNSGLHSRIGQNPRWVVEGLATMLETGILQSEASGGTGSKVNLERLKAYFDYRKSHPRHSIMDFVADDEPTFQQDPLEAYGVAWALTFYLVEHHRTKYFQYLQRIKDRDPLEPRYTAAERIRDFQAVFGSDTSLLEAQMIRYYNGMH